MTINKVLGFYVKVGSIDYPFNTSINDAFGWDPDDSSKAVFSYSINDVEKAFTTVREFSQAANYISSSTDFIGDPTGATNRLLIECGKTEAYDYTALATENPGDQFWQDVFRCIEYLGRNQATVQGASWSSNYANYGDAILASPTLANGTTNTYYVSNYIKGSFQYAIRPNSTRLRWVQFSINDINAGNVTCQIYLDADAWCELSTTVKYQVYTYEDLDGDSTISTSEMNTQVVGKLFDILHSGKYNNYSSYIVDKRISDTSTVSEQFFVFSNVRMELTADKMKEQIKQYLREKYSGNDTYLRYTYPTLFDENEIRIIPVWDNQITQATGESKDVRPLSLSKLATVLSSYGYSVSQSSSDYRPSEIFYIGPGAGWSPSVAIKFVLPIIAVEQDTTSGIQYPISSRFPSFKPIYGENDAGPAAEFHFVLLTIINFLNDGNTSLNSDFISDYSVSTSTNGTRKTVSFTFGGDLYKVYGKAGSASN